MKRINTPAGVKKPKFGMMPKNKSIRISKWIPVMILILAYSILFFCLRGKVLFTPDLDRSDAFHLNVAFKYYLSHALHHNTLPFWTQQLQGGFPLLAEGQIGALYLPNLILYRLFPFTDAYMLSFVGSIFIFNLGFFLLLRHFGTSRLLAFLLSVSGAFAGFMTYRWVHFNLLQTVSLFPFLFLSAEYAYYSNSIRAKIAHVFIISQLIFAGHIQVAFIGILSLLAWYMVVGIANKAGILEISKKLIKNVMLPIFLGSLLSLPQIVPTILLMRYSGRALQSGYAFATSYSLPLKHAVSFLTPYLFGNPKYHTYPLSLSQWGVFWENSPYIGEALCLVIMAALIISAFNRKFTSSKGFPYLILSAGFLILAFGSNSPFYFVFDIPPFSLFRTPPKYLIPSAFFLIWGGSFYIASFLKTIKSSFIYLCLYLLLAANVIILINTAFSYHVFVDEGKIMDRSSVSYPLNNDDRYLTLGFSPRWSSYLAKHGWADNEDISVYERFDSSLIPQSNFMYGGETMDINTGGLRFRRVDLINSYLDEFLSASDSAEVATASSLISMTGLNTFISTFPIAVLTPSTYKVAQAAGLYYYRSKQNQKGYYVPRILNEIKYTDDIDPFIREGKFSTEEAVVEGLRSEVFDSMPSVSILKNSETSFKAVTFGTKSAFLVIAKNWYPEWNVTVDGVRVKPVKTNLIHMGIALTPGRHSISATYTPYAFYVGLAGASVGLAGIVVWIWLVRYRK